MTFVRPHPHLGTLFGKVGFQVTSEYSFFKVSYDPVSNSGPPRPQRSALPLSHGGRFVVVVVIVIVIVVVVVAIERRQITATKNVKSVRKK